MRPPVRRWTRLVTIMITPVLIMIGLAGSTTRSVADASTPEVSTALASRSVSVQSLTNGAHKIDPPYLGWSSWSLQASKYPGLNADGDYSWLTEQAVLAQAKVMATKLKKHGYRYVNIDAGWWREWDWTPEYDGHGRYAVDKARFPHGIANVASRVHALGLKLGIYVPVGLEKGAYDNGDFPIAGSSACSTHDVVYDDLRTTNGWDSSYAMDFSKPCAQAYIDSLARQYRAWGVDFLKIDGVGYGSNRSADREQVAGQYDNRADLAAWKSAFAKAKADVEVQISWSLNQNYVADWQQLSDSWRIDGDVECYCDTLVQWSSHFGPFQGGVKGRFTDVIDWIGAGGYGKGWNNLDSLDVGNGEMDGLTKAERQTYMTLWAIENSPLYSGDDLTRLDAYGLSLLTNDEVLAVDQAGTPARPLDTSSDQQVWVATYRGVRVVALFNLSDEAATTSVDFADLGVSSRGSSAAVRDLWAHKNLGVASSFSTELPAHGSRLLVLATSH